MGAKELLEQDHPRQLVGQRDLAKGNSLLRPAEDALGEAERSPDHEPQVAAGAAPLLEQPGERFARVLATAAVEGADVRIGWDPPQNRLPLPVRIGLRELHRLETGVAAEQPLVVRDVVLERRANLSDTCEDNAHSGAILDRR